MSSYTEETLNAVYRNIGDSLVLDDQKFLIMNRSVRTPSVMQQARSQMKLTFLTSVVCPFKQGSASATLAIYRIQRNERAVRHTESSPLDETSICRSFLDGTLETVVASYKRLAGETSVMFETAKQQRGLKTVSNCKVEYGIKRVPAKKNSSSLSFKGHRRGRPLPIAKVSPLEKKVSFLLPAIESPDDTEVADHHQRSKPNPLKVTFSIDFFN